MRRVLSYFILLSFLGCSSPSRDPSNVFYRDDRVSIAKDGTLPIGTIHPSIDSDRPWGTGFQIDACHVVTNYHVVLNVDSIPNEELSVYFEDRDSRTAAKLVLWGKPFQRPPKVSSNLEDWALLRLESCLPKEIYFKLTDSSTNLYRDDNLKMMGFPSDRGKNKISLDPMCEIHGQSPRGIHHDCAGRPGSSGSPIYYENGDELIVVAINVAQRSDFDELIGSYSHWIANTAVPSTNYAKIINDYLTGLTE